ncbi:helix-turn-helix domain-containing protein [Ferrimonas marina]|uniref:Bacteriophage CI repressor helix-turn-helix domain-containing protein n=1 Tax=Ferrimonas marina TaxID=299255 RepID=A0A1M5UN21_9GAMM|nr:helix-turn-helix domain-containing protein [Ferrimonas marina]SHH64268.1 hypothetical protein SAMN02745129_2642 [Ferrimonas marina]
MQSPMSPSQFLDLIKEALNVGSDYQVHKRLGVSVQSVSTWRRNTNYPGEVLVLNMASEAGIEPSVLLLHRALWLARGRSDTNQLNAMLAGHPDKKALLRQ